MNENKCEKCGKFLPLKGFYTLKREKHIMKVWICPYCGNRVVKIYDIKS